MGLAIALGRHLDDAGNREKQAEADRCQDDGFTGVVTFVPSPLTRLVEADHRSRQGHQDAHGGPRAQEREAADHHGLAGFLACCACLDGREARIPEQALLDLPLGFAQQFGERLHLRGGNHRCVRYGARSRRRRGMR